MLVDPPYRCNVNPLNDWVCFYCGVHAGEERTQCKLEVTLSSNHSTCAVSLISSLVILSFLVLTKK